MEGGRERGEGGYLSSSREGRGEGGHLMKSCEKGGGGRVPKGVAEAPNLVHTSGIWVTGIKREASDSKLCRLGQTQSTQGSKASKQKASHLLAELRRDMAAMHDCYRNI